MGKSRCKGRKFPVKKPVWLIAVVALVVALVITLMFTSGAWKGHADQPSGSGTESQTGTKPSGTLVQQAKADYEKWLAAAMVVGLSMEYPDFELHEIYAATETAIEEKQNSEGVYIFFTSGGECKVLQSVPLENERTTAGTKDISTKTLGFASFDIVAPISVNTEPMKRINLEELTELIEQSLLVSIYAH